jgi:hypothetical protein
VTQFATVLGNAEMDPPSATPSVAPSASPIAEPTLAPTAVPSTTPTITGSVTVISFDSTFTLQGVTESPLSPPSQLSIRQAVAESMDVHLSTTSLVSQNAVSTVRKLSAGLFSTTVVVNTQVSTTTTPQTAYNSLFNKLVSAVSSGAFKTALQSHSSQNGAAGTASVSVVDVTVGQFTTPSDVDKKSDKNMLSNAETAGIIIAVFIAAILIVATMVGLYSRHIKSTTATDTSDHVNAIEKSLDNGGGVSPGMIRVNMMEFGESGKIKQIQQIQRRKEPASPKNI